MEERKRSGLNVAAEGPKWETSAHLKSVLIWREKKKRAYHDFPPVR